ncbi:hypothetical protein GCM10023116_41990 [Kistimonas scapharcae]|uniref:Porin n=2 Tax=Kistimonas scapharcae TaxID=1036133 RepID=A0ABP8V7C4_9GAMM
MLPFIYGVSQADIADNLRWTIDGSARYNQFSSPDRTSRIYALGIDTHKVFSGEHGDIGYSVIQLYFTQLSHHKPTPFMFDSPDDGKIIVREAHINYTASPGWLPNLRLGHFTMPFGLEDSNDTNGKLLDYGHAENLGTKLDWGILLNKVHDDFEYKISYTLGGKDDPKSVDGSSLVTGRISTLDHYNLVVGFSFYDGELDNRNRQRFAVDMQYYIGTWGVKAELATGEVDDDNEKYGLFEINKLSLDETWKLYSQYIYSDKSGFDDNNETGVVGISYEPDTHWEASVEYKHQFSNINGLDEMKLFRTQIRYRY